MISFLFLVHFHFHLIWAIWTKEKQFTFLGAWAETRPRRSNFMSWHHNKQNNVTFRTISVRLMLSPLKIKHLTLPIKICQFFNWLQPFLWFDHKIIDLQMWRLLNNSRCIKVCSSSCNAQLLNLMANPLHDLNIAVTSWKIGALVLK